MEKKPARSKPTSAEERLFTAPDRIELALNLLLKAQLQGVYDANIDTPELEKLYQRTGTRTVSELSREFGFSTGKISMLPQKWEQMGLLVKAGMQYEKTV